MPVHELLPKLLANIRRESRRNYTPPLRAAILFSVPPAAILLVANGLLQPVYCQVASVLVVVVTVTYNFSIKGYFSESFDPNQSGIEFATKRLEEHIWTTEGFSEQDEASILLEYEQISDERRSSNKIVIQATYFSLATFGILATVFFTLTHSVFQPLIAEFGMFIAFAFLVIVEKHVRIRQALRERQQAIEEIPSLDGRLSLANTWDIALEHGLYPGADISEQLIDFNRFWLWAWIVIYHGSTLYAAFVILPA